MALHQELLSLESVGSQGASQGSLGPRKGLLVVWGTVQRMREAISTAHGKNARGPSATLRTGARLARLGWALLQAQKRDFQPVQ